MYVYEFVYVCSNGFGITASGGSEEAQAKAAMPFVPKNTTQHINTNTSTCQNRRGFLFCLLVPPCPSRTGLGRALRDCSRTDSCCSSTGCGVFRQNLAEEKETEKETEKEK